MPDLEYVARVDGAAGPRGTVVTAADWAELDDHTREDFTAREVREPVTELRELPPLAAKEE